MIDVMGYPVISWEPASGGLLNHFRRMPALQKFPKMASETEEFPFIIVITTLLYLRTSFI